MNGLSVIIPSRSMYNLMPCIQAVRKHEPSIPIIVIWDAPKTGDSAVLDLWAVQNRLNQSDTSGCGGMVLRGEQPFIFARNCNIGIQAAGDSDVVLLNDDALLESEAGFTAMQRAAEDNPQYGLISATTNLAGNPAQMRRDETGLRMCSTTPGNSIPVVAFVCVLIPRRTIDMVGLLDERFTAYGWEDNDYCRRVHAANRRIGIFDGCYVDHAKLKSTFRGDAYAAGSIEAGKQIYLEKWGRM